MSPRNGPKPELKDIACSSKCTTKSSYYIFSQNVDQILHHFVWRSSEITLTNGKGKHVLHKTSSLYFWRCTNIPKQISLLSLSWVVLVGGHWSLWLCVELALFAALGTRIIMGAQKLQGGDGVTCFAQAGPPWPIWFHRRRGAGRGRKERRCSHKRLVGSKLVRETCFS